MEWITANAAIIFAALTFAAGLIWGKPAVDAFLASKRTREILQMVSIAFNAVEEMHRIKPMPSVDKSAAFLDQLVQLALQAGMDPPTPEEKTLALTAAKALNYAQKNKAALGPT